MSDKTRSEETYDIFAQFEDGLTANELIALLDTKEDKRCASARLSQFVREGLAVKDGQRPNPVTGHNCDVYRLTGLPYADRYVEKRAPKRKRRGPFEDEVKQLRAWKADAIARYPDLALDPSIRAAREHIAEIFRADGLHVKAELVASGEMDQSEIMRAVVALLQERP